MAAMLIAAHASQREPGSLTSRSVTCTCRMGTSGRFVLDNENVYEIFRSLNSTGQPLSEADLVRNFVFMHISLDEQDRFDDESWVPIERHFEEAQGNLKGGALSGFFRDFLMRTGRYVKPAATFQKFAPRYSGAGFDSWSLAIELGRYADHHDVVRGVKRHSSDSVEKAWSNCVGSERPRLIHCS